MCFEGACFKRSVVQKIGLPDARFFIYWDDALYGYLASKVTQPILIPDFVLQDVEKFLVRVLALCASLIQPLT